jgi:phosphatidylserine/phosphatidylglycerophosphate/cardiolipin synthase-like enzyme
MRRFLLLMLLLGLGCNDSPRDAAPLSSAGQPAGGPVRVYFTTPERPAAESEIVRALVGYIDQAKRSIDVAAFELNNRAVTDALVRAVKRGVRVRLACETDYVNDSGVQALRTAGVGVVDDRRDGALMHDKFMVFDGKAVWTGSMNFSENCAYRNNNNGIYLDDTRVAADYATKFAWMFEQHRFGGLPSRDAKIPHPQVTLADGTPAEVYFSTHDHIAARLTEKLREAKKSIHFLAFSFTHDGMGRAMREAAAAGVEVRGVFEKSQAASGFSEFGKMKDVGGIDVYLDANPYNMHHKVLILDDETVVAGSFNFSDGADRQNDENVVILKSRALARQFEEEFQRVYTAARRVDAPLASIHKRRR